LTSLERHKRGWPAPRHETKRFDDINLHICYASIRRYLAGAVTANQAALQIDRSQTKATFLARQSRWQSSCSRDLAYLATVGGVALMAGKPPFASPRIVVLANGSVSSQPSKE
jgi:hypothetical protein